MPVGALRLGSRHGLSKMLSRMASNIYVTIMEHYDGSE
jgi:hypothetical protein